MRTERNIDDLKIHGLSRFNTASTSCTLSQVMRFCSQAIDILNAEDKGFLFKEDHFDFLIADCRGNEYARCMRVGDSSIYSGTESRFVIWGREEMFKAIKDSVNPEPKKK